MKRLLPLLLVLATAFAPALAQAAPGAQMTIAAAADLHEAMDQVVVAYRRDHPAATINVTYGSSGTLTTQIEQGAPFDLFFSADSDYPRQLIAHGDAGGLATPYAVGHLVLWSASLDMHGVKLADLAQPRFGRIAIANPEHAPYGKRAVQALRGAGVWDAIQPRIVYGENIAQAAQFASSGNVQVGVIALSLALRPEMKGSYALVPDSAFDPLVQSFVLTKGGAGNDLAQDFARYAQSPAARAILGHFGFNPPGGEP
jgi:molybdate transport system substrate-binding protein